MLSVHTLYMFDHVKPVNVEHAMSCVHSWHSCCIEFTTLRKYVQTAHANCSYVYACIFAYSQRHYMENGDL